MGIVSSVAEPVFFLENTYDEAYSLLIEAREFMEHTVPEYRKRVTQLQRLMLTKETMRLTTRLTQIMAWLLTQKAVHLEQMTPNKAMQSAYRLGGQKVCLDLGDGDQEILPPQLRNLLNRSYDLYVRINRLDRQIASE